MRIAVLATLSLVLLAAGAVLPATAGEDGQGAQVPPSSSAISIAPSLEQAHDLEDAAVEPEVADAALEPTSEPIITVSGPLDSHQIDLRVTHSWPGTIVLNWNHEATVEEVLFDGEVVGQGKRGWARITDVPYGAEFDVTIRAGEGNLLTESEPLRIQAASVDLRDVRQFTAKPVGSDSVKLNFRKDPWVEFEIYRDGELIAVVQQSDAVPFYDTGLIPGATYTYSMRQVADGADGVSRFVTATVTMPDK